MRIQIVSFGSAKARHLNYPDGAQVGTAVADLPNNMEMCFPTCGCRASPLSGAWLLLPVLWLGSAVGLTAAEATAPAVTAVQKAVSDWARIREETVRLESTWETERQLLESTLKVMQERARALADEKKTLESKTAGDREALARLVAENGGMQTTLDAAAARLKKVSDQLIEMRPLLPPRLSRALELPYRSLANPALTPGERMQHVTTVLNRCAQFNKAITYDEEPLTIGGDQQERLLEVIYWGASHAYALDRTENKAYFGSPGETGWTWEPAPGAAKEITELIAIYREKSDPQFVQVPARFRHALSN